jgi:hypothetical protein
MASAATNGNDVMDLKLAIWSLAVHTPIEMLVENLLAELFPVCRIVRLIHLFDHGCVLVDDVNYTGRRSLRGYQNPERSDEPQYLSFVYKSGTDYCLGVGRRLIGRPISGDRRLCSYLLVVDAPEESPRVVIGVGSSGLLSPYGPSSVDAPFRITFSLPGVVSGACIRLEPPVRSGHIRSPRPVEKNGTILYKRTQTLVKVKRENKNH